ncbi:MAG: 4'-phosphopantetheinyl transferase superfamily protein [Bacteroidales bacterium]
MVDVFGIKIPGDGEFEKLKETLFSFIPPENINQIVRFKNINDKKRSLLGEVLCRKCLGEKLSIPSCDIEIKKTENGTPYLQEIHPDIFFNLSHSGDWVVAALSEREIGLDVEKIKKPSYRIAERYFSTSELDALNSLKDQDKANYFYDLWTLKESYLKLLGKGLTKSLGSFSISGQHGNFQLINDNSGHRNVYFRQYNIDPDYKFSVCSEDNKFSDNIHILIP